MKNSKPDTPLVWQPTEEYVNGSHLKQFMDRHGLSTFAEALQRSIEDGEWFWQAVLEDLDIQFFKPYQRVYDTSAGRPWTRWCVGGQLNIVHNCLDKWTGTAAENKVAVRWEGEEGAVRSLTYKDLFQETNRLAAGLRSIGLGKGDVVGLYMPMVPETVIALLATVKIGGVVLPLFSGYGAPAVANRLMDAGAKALVTADGFYRRGKLIAMKSLADEAVAMARASIQHVIVVKRAGNHVPWTAGRDHWWHELADQPVTEGEAATEPTDAEDPLMLIYTSGTTGRPKGTVHTHCGFPVKAAQDMAHAFDLQSTDTLYWVTDIGWMMGPWQIFGALLRQATMIIYDGAPDYPGPDRLWRIVADHGVSILGVSPTLIRALMRHGPEPVQTHDLSSLRILGSTGEPWNPAPWWWFFDIVGRKRLPIINYSGGTEVSGGILGGNVLTPLKPCAFSAPVLGMAADVVDERGHSVRGQVGELVVRKPWIGMTRGFWRDPERYLESYWSRFPNVWAHGDWARQDDDGLWYILGRSDDTIKVAGKRVGPAEVESVLTGHDAVAEAAVIGVPDPLKGEAIVCFCVLKQDSEPGPELEDELRQLTAQQLSKALTPQRILFVSDLPKTRNAKIMRRVIRAVYLGEEPGDLSALENPAAVAEIRRAQSL